MTKTEKNDKFKDFETALARLEEIVSELESGEKSLEESIAQYTEGIEIAAVCHGKLGDAEGQIAKLSKIAEKFNLEQVSGNDNE